jgi:hypothetical protein
MNSNDVIDRDSFLKYRATWKVVYAFITEDIRTLKQVRSGQNVWPSNRQFPKDRSKVQRETSIMRKRASDLMKDLARAKAKRPVYDQ